MFPSLIGKLLSVLLPKSAKPQPVLIPVRKGSSAVAKTPTKMTSNWMLLFGLGMLGAGACTDPVDLDSTFEGPQPVVEAWLTNEAVEQTINLTYTQDFFANTLPTSLTGAEVVVCQTTIGSDCFVFAEAEPGRYVWTPSPTSQYIGEVGETFTLTVEDGDQVYTSTTSMGRVPAIDSISFQFEEEQLGLDEGLYAQVYARDLPGVGDRYLIRTTINDTLLNRIEELNIAYDAAFDGGTPTDGIYFILPIRTGINKLDSNQSFIPLLTGDVVEVDIWSISATAFDFLRGAQTQIQNGDAQLFAVPVVSTRGNVEDTNGEFVIGMFNVAAVSSAVREVP
ncbi:MAG: DUF4249 domain-containing protein [Saprospiraceae bacterium]